MRFPRKFVGHLFMKAYLITTGTIFGLIALMHILHSIADRDRLTTHPTEYLFMGALGLLAAFLSVWAWRLLWSRAWNSLKNDLPS